MSQKEDLRHLDPIFVAINVAKMIREAALNTDIQIQTALGKFPGGATAKQIKEIAKLSMSLRTVQRKLEDMIEKRLVKTSGFKKSARYHLVNTVVTTEKPDHANGVPAQAMAFLSKESEAILAALSVPFDHRNAVGYNRSFADNYRPNIDFYLSEKERDQLATDAITHDRNQPAGTYAKHILQRLLIDLSWNSSRLEGNTYSLLETERLLAEGIPATDKSAIETQMILNHKDAIEFMVGGGEEIGFNRYTLLNLHALLANNLLPDPAAPGRLRYFGVGIRKSAFTPTAIPQLIEEMFEKILAKAAAINNPHEQALFIMVQLPYLQPFEDVNKRVSRLAANISLNQHNLVPISFIGVPEDVYIKGLLGVYELNQVALLKDIFLLACARSADRYASVRQTISEPDPFRLQYRQLLQTIVMEIIAGQKDRHQASIIIRARALQLPSPDDKHFTELAETELMSLHEGNFARYRIRPAEFAAWKKKWDTVG